MNYHNANKKKNLLLSILLIIKFLLFDSLYSFEKPQILGALQVLYDYNFSNKENSFSSYRTSFGLDGNISKRVGYRILISLNPKLYNFEGFDFYGRFLTPFGEIRIGQFKVPFSMERLTSFYRRDFVENAITTGFVNGRDIGIGIYGDKKWVEYNMGIFNGEGMNKKDSNKTKDVTGRIALKKAIGENISLLLGSAFYSGKTGEDQNLKKRNLFNLQFKGRLNHFAISSEYVIFADSNDSGNAFYSTFGYHFFFQKHKIEPMIRYEFYDPDKPLSDGVAKKITFGINFYLKDYNFRIQINVSRYILENRENYTKLFILSQFVF